jgi:two-component system C4-dicarboxylate transport response regulator DctD
VLFQHFADEASAAMACRRTSCNRATRAAAAPHWPGNVRELQNAAERFALGLELALDNQQGQPAPLAVSAAA